MGSIPLKRGTWMHKLIAAHYGTGDWEKEHDRLTKQYNTLMLEEREHYGDLPTECDRLMRSYLYHYRREDDDWEILYVEEEYEVTLYTDDTFSITPDLIIREKSTGLVGCVDHKNMKSIPTAEARLMDLQSVIYPQVLEKAGIEVDFFLFNYIRTKPPTIPHLNLDGTMSKARIDTDYRTLAKFIKENDIPLTKALKTRLKNLKDFNPFFHRVRLTKPKVIADRLMEEVRYTIEEMEAFHEMDEEGEIDPWIRSMQLSCDWDCDFYELCMVELMGGNTKFLKRRKYQQSEYAKRKQIGKR